MSLHTSAFRTPFMAATALALLGASSWAGPAAAHESIEHYLFVPDRVLAQVTVIDSETDTVIARVKVGKVPHQVAVSATTGKFVASNTADDTISIVDLKTFKTRSTLRLGSAPEHMALSPDGRLLAVGNIDGGTVSLVDLVGEREIARVPGLFEPHNLTFSRDGSRLYVANLGADHVSVVDIARARVVAEIPVAEPRLIAAKATDPGADYQGIINVTASADGRLGFAASGEAGALAVIDLDRGEKVTTLSLGERPWRAYASADGRYMIVPNNGDATVSIVSAKTFEVVATLPGAVGVTGVNTDASGKIAFVISRSEEKVVMLDLESLSPAGEIALPGKPETGVV
ncbi:MAG: cytochrome D1 domain-containing protein, partial [Alphaproteobacteria bacterium]